MLREWRGTHEEGFNISYTIKVELPSLRPRLSAFAKLSAGVRGVGGRRGLSLPPGQLLRGQARIFRGAGPAGVAGPGWQMITAIMGTLHAKGLTALCSP